MVYLLMSAVKLAVASETFTPRQMRCLFDAIMACYTEETER